MNNCLSGLILLFLLVFFSPWVTAQKFYAHQISVVSDNDNYTLKRKDRYYTNGLSLRFSKLISDEAPDQSKKYGP